MIKSIADRIVGEEKSKLDEIKELLDFCGTVDEDMQEIGNSELDLPR